MPAASEGKAILVPHELQGHLLSALSLIQLHRPVRLRGDGKRGESPLQDSRGSRQYSGRQRWGNDRILLPSVVCGGVIFDDAIDATAMAVDHAFEALHQNSRSQDIVEHPEFPIAKLAAGLGGARNGTMIFDQKQDSVFVFGNLGHVTFFAAAGHELGETIANRSAGTRLSHVSLGLFLGKLREELAETFRSKRLLCALQEVQRHCGMIIRETVVRFAREFPDLGGPAFGARFFDKRHQLFFLQIVEMLTNSRG